jgi:hypothetical protein
MRLAENALEAILDSDALHSVLAYGGTNDGAYHRVEPRCVAAASQNPDLLIHTTKIILSDNAR